MLKYAKRSSLVAEWVKNPSLSRLWLWLLLWRGFSPWPQGLPHAMGVAKKGERGEEGNSLQPLELSLAHGNGSRRVMPVTTRCRPCANGISVLRVCHSRVQDEQTSRFRTELCARLSTPQSWPGPQTFAHQATWLAFFGLFFLCFSLPVP